jgi:RHS repeat-associated protein
LSVILILLISNKICTAQTQADVTLNTVTTTPGTINAYHSITLANGFSYNGINGPLVFKIVAPPIPVTAGFGTTPSDENYIWTKTPRIPITDASTLNSKTTDQLMQSIQYLDGLGRPMQTIQIKGNADGTKDVIQPVGYDDFGRESLKYLPYAEGTAATGSFRSGALQGAQSGYYASPPTGITQTNSPYMQTIFEPSPANRVMEQGNAGDVWQVSSGHTQKMEYSVNAASSVKYYVATNVGTTGQEYKRRLLEVGYYGAGELYLTVSKNENWVSTDGHTGTTEEYRDKEGKVVLKRVFNTGNIPYSTYYVHDYKGNLSFVLPPGANPDAGSIGQTALDNFCYQYRYDGRGRMVEKKVPGKGWEYSVYNPLDQVVLTQDSSQRNNGTWLFSKYDEVSRVAMTGIYTNTSAREAEQNILNSQYFSSEFSDNTSPSGYTNFYYPTTNTTPLKVNFYDDYSFPNSSTVANQSSVANYGYSLLTGNLIYTLDGSASYLSANYYDPEKRVVESIRQNHLAGTDRVLNTYSFTGSVLTSTLTHIASSATTTVTKSYVYDHLDRKRQTKEKINNDAEILLSQTDFNDLGQAITKHLHSDDNGVSFLQDINYTYNERGWLRTANTNGNVFNFELRYNAPEAGVIPAFNGNISQMLYNTTHVPSPGARKFSYSYDPLNRLKQATSNMADMDETVVYNEMGNITSLTRTGMGSGATTDVLDYHYLDAGGNNTNQLFSVGKNGSTYRSYSYDANGNATSDGDATSTGGISNRKTIGFNLFDLPQTVKKNGTTIATYLYDANSAKLHTTGSDGTWDYDGEIIYKNAAIELIQTEDGRAVQNGNAYNYIYDLKDHLGNVRVSIDKYNNTARVVQEDEYYSFGLLKRQFNNTNRFLYNGKELQGDLTNQYDYGARFYDPVVARWTTVDPLAEKSAKMSPYNYVSNNPVSRIDPDGMEDGGSYLTNDQGEIASVLGAIEAGESVSVGGNPKEEKPKPKPAEKSSASRYVSQFVKSISNFDFGQAVTNNWINYADHPEELGKVAVNSVSSLYWSAVSLLDYNTYVSTYNNIVSYANATPEQRAAGDAAFFNNFLTGFGTFAPFTELSAFKLTTNFEGFLGGSIGLKTPFDIKVGLYPSKNTLSYGTFNYSTLAPDFLGRTNFFGRNMLQITTDFQPKLGIWSKQVIPAGTYIRVGLVGPQPGMGIGSWLQIYAPNGVPYHK